MCATGNRCFIYLWHKIYLTDFNLKAWLKTVIPAMREVEAEDLSLRLGLGKKHEAQSEK
jgi:hypothetical protein